MDTVIGRYATRINGVTDFVITKLDVLTGFEQVPICVAYDVEGVRFDEMPMGQSDFHHAKPIYELMDGWWEDISGCRTFEDLPAAAQAYVLRVEELIGARVSAIGVGPGRHEIIERFPCSTPEPQLLRHAEVGCGRRNSRASGQVPRHAEVGLCGRRTDIRCAARVSTT